MINAILSFLILFGVFFVGIAAFRKATEKQKWQLTKLVGYSTMCAVFATAILVSIYILG
jgi:hypothetical protein